MTGMRAIYWVTARKMRIYNDKKNNIQDLYRSNGANRTRRPSKTLIYQPCIKSSISESFLNGSISQFLRVSNDQLLRKNILLRSNDEYSMHVQIEMMG